MKTMNNLIISLLLSMFFTYNCFGQDKVSGGSGGFRIGFKQYPTTAFGYFTEEGVTDLEDNLITIGGGGYHIIKNWMIGAYGFYRGGDRQDVSLDQPNSTTSEVNYSINGGGGYLTLGYVVFNTDKLLIFPQAGIGLEALTLSKTTDRDVRFDADDFLRTDYTWYSPMLDLGVGVDFFLLKRLKIGLRAGYNLSVQRDNDWNHSGGEFTGEDLPENDLDGAYVSLIIGGGWIGNQ